MREETLIQRDVRKYLAGRGYVSVHVPNGATLSGDRQSRARQMANLKRDGLMVGFPDLMVFNTRGAVGFMEVKTPTGKLSQNQSQVQSWMERDGFKYAVVRSKDDARETIKAWGWL